MINVNATLVLQIIQFLILTFVLNRLMFQPILKMIHDRDQFIKKTKKEAETVEEETSQLIERCISMEKASRQEAGVERSQIKKEANTMAEEIIDEARKEVALIRGEASKKIDEQVKKVKQFIHNEAVTLADEVTQIVIGREG